MSACTFTATLVFFVSYKKGGLLKRPPSELNPGDALLSHGETPHYHRRKAVSLLSSAWNQVVPTRYVRQENFLPLGNLCVEIRSTILSASHKHD